MMTNEVTLGCWTEGWTKEAVWRCDFVFWEVVMRNVHSFLDKMSDASNETPPGRSEGRKVPDGHFCSWLTIIDIRPSTVRSNVSHGPCVKWFTKTFVQKMYLQLQKALWLLQSLLLKILLKYEGLHTAADNMMMWVYRQHTQELWHKPRWAKWPHNTSHSPSLLLLEHLLVTASRCVQVDHMRG